MEQFRNALSIIAGIMFLVGFVPYIRAILRKETKPAKASWIIWASLDYIVFAGMIAEKTVNGQILGAVAGATIVIGLALKYGTSGWTNIDKLCLGGAVLGIALWRVFNDPVLGIMTSCTVAFFGSIPTFVSAWKDPSREDKLAWTIFWVSCVCAVIAIPHWTPADAAQPLTFFAIESVMMYILYTRPRSLAPAVT
jgi:hypothetical protein